MIKDLVVLVADLDSQITVAELLAGRHRSLGIRPLSFDIIRHTMRDSGCCKGAADMLRRHQQTHDKALVIFDRQGCGRDQDNRATIEADVEESLSHSGWTGRAAVIVLDPELEIWVWSDSPEVDGALGWRDHMPSLREFLIRNHLIGDDQVKPSDPKAALKQALREVRKSYSASLFSLLAAKVGLSRCTDSAFLKLKSTLQTWFPAEP